MKILLTGFEPFGEVLDNPSQRVVEHFAAKPLAAEQATQLITVVLPVDYVAASTILQNLLEEHKPDAVLMLGVAQKRDSINLEHIAININDAQIADNAGNQKSGQKIVAGAPANCRSTLPLIAMYEAIQSAGVAVIYSNYAGTYLCKHVFYVARHWLENAGLGHIPCGFIHLPDMGEEAPKMPLAKMIRAVRLSLGVIISKKETFSNIMKHLEKSLSLHLFQKFDFILFSDLDSDCGIYIRKTPNLEEDWYLDLSVSMASMGERLCFEFDLGQAIYHSIVGNKGTVLQLELPYNHILTMRFAGRISFSELGQIADKLHDLARGINLVLEPTPTKTKGEKKNFIDDYGTWRKERKEIITALGTLRERLHNTVDWMAVGSGYGFYYGGIGCLPEKSRVAAMMAAIDTREMKRGDFGLGEFRAYITVGENGAIIQMEIEPEYLLMMKFGNGIKFSHLMNVAILTSSVISELRKIIRENPF